MPSFGEVYFRPTNSELYTDEVWEGKTPWAPHPPPTHVAANNAAIIAQKCQDTYDRLMDVVTFWKQFKDVYGGADKEIVFMAMDPVVEKLIAIQRAGEVFSTAVQSYDAMNSGTQELKTSYDEWARDFVERYRKADEDKARLGNDEEGLAEFERLYGMNHALYIGSLEQERAGRIADGPEYIVNHVNKGRQDLAGTLTAIDMGELGKIAFSHREESLTVYGTPEELAAALESSEVFGNTDLTHKDYQAIAEEMWASYQDLPFEYEDDNGIRWSTGPNGEMVRSGSPMDPNVSSLAFLTLGRDPNWSTVELNVPGELASGATATAGYLINKGGGKLSGKFQDVVDPTTPLGKSAISAGTGLLLTVFNAGVDASHYKIKLAGEAALLSPEEASALRRRAASRNLLDGAVDLGLGTGQVFATAMYGTGGKVVGWIVTDVAGKVIDVIIDEAYDETWSKEEMERAYLNGEFPE